VLAEVLRLPPPIDQVEAPPERETAELALLGGFRLLKEGKPLQVSASGQRLLAVVACRPAPVVRSQVAHLLWPDTRSARAQANLRTAVYRLERSCPGVLIATGSHLRLAAGIRVDVEVITWLSSQVLSSEGSLSPELAREALQANLYDDLLPDWNEEWLAPQQSRYRTVRLAMLEMLSRRLAATGQHGAAVHAALAAVHADPLRDSAHQALIRACLVQGNRHEAQSHFATYQRVFREELGVEPDATAGQLLHGA
jgi:DNA-binding SARP family transcriptional activator